MRSILKQIIPFLAVVLAAPALITGCAAQGTNSKEF
jgi:hypothetical protein